MRPCVVFSLVLLIGLVVATGCRPAATKTTDIRADLVLEPSPPTVGQANVAVALTDAAGKPLEGADVKLEGNMNHAGMKPSFADLEEIEPGRYSGQLDFTMGGDWFVLVTARTADGAKVEHKFDVPGVKTK